MEGKIDPGIKLTPFSQCVSTLLFADDQVIMQKREKDLQLAVFHLSPICKEYNLRISTHKTKDMGFRGKNPIRSKIIINNLSIEKVSHFNFLKCDVTYEYDSDIDIPVSYTHLDVYKRQPSNHYRFTIKHSLL